MDVVLKVSWVKRCAQALLCCCYVAGSIVFAPFRQKRHILCHNLKFKLSFLESEFYCNVGGTRVCAIAAEKALLALLGTSLLKLWSGGPG